MASKARRHRLGIGTTRTMRSVVVGIFAPVMLSKVYTLKEKVDLWRGKWSASSTHMWNEIPATDLAALVGVVASPHVGRTTPGSEREG